MFPAWATSYVILLSTELRNIGSGTYLKIKVWNLCLGKSSEAYILKQPIKD